MPATLKFGDWEPQRVTGLLVLADGTVLEGFGFGAEGEAVGPRFHQSTNLQLFHGSRTTHGY